MTIRALAPPVEIAPLTIHAVAARHAGHMAPSSTLAGFGPLADARVDKSPSLGHALPMIVLNQSQRFVGELNQSAAVNLAQAVLNVRSNGYDMKRGP